MSTFYCNKNGAVSVFPNDIAIFLLRNQIKFHFDQAQLFGISNRGDISICSSLEKRLINCSYITLCNLDLSVLNNLMNILRHEGILQRRYSDLLFEITSIFSIASRVINRGYMELFRISTLNDILFGVIEDNDDSSVLADFELEYKSGQSLSKSLVKFSIGVTFNSNRGLLRDRRYSLIPETRHFFPPLHFS